MTGKDAIKTALQSTQNLFNMYVADLSDADLLERPVPGANHIAWQIGHLIGAEISLAGDNLPGVAYPALPAGFADKHTKATASADAAGSFLKKDDYVGLFNKVREATLAGLAK